ncbi:MAG: EamA family transporter [Candidatus Altimarinota bacterium]
MTFFFAITLCILLGSLGRISMKKALEHKPPLICAFIFEVAQVLIALPFLFLYEVPSTLHYSFISGSIFAFSLFFYFLSFEGGEVSLLSPFRGLRGVIALCLSFFWWQDALSWGEISGILIIGLGVLFLQRGSEFKKFLHFFFHKEAVFMMISVTLGVISSWFDKLGSAELGIYTHYLWTCTAAMVVLLLGVLLQYGQKTWKTVSSNVSVHNVAVGLIFSGAYVTHLLSLQLERVTIVNALLPLGTLITTFLAAYFLNEPIREKIPGTVLMVLGTIFIALS